MGFDDVFFAAGLSTALTTVRVPYEDLGRTAVRPALNAPTVWRPTTTWS